MGPEFGHDAGVQARLQGILHQAKDRYGEGAYFVYLRQSDRQLITMTLEQAMAICGAHMADEDDSVLWATLDKWHEAAARLEASYPDRFASSVGLGRSALAARGIGTK